MKAAVLSIGVVNIITGKTSHGWSIYDQQGVKLFLAGSRLLYASHDTFEIGDDVDLINNDSNRRLGIHITIIDSCEAKKENLIKMLFDNGYDYRPLAPFKKRKFKNKLSTSFSVKGTFK